MKVVHITPTKNIGPPKRLKLREVPEVMGKAMLKNNHYNGKGRYISFDEMENYFKEISKEQFELIKEEIKDKEEVTAEDIIQIIEESSKKESPPADEQPKRKRGRKPKE